MALLIACLASPLAMRAAKKDVTFDNFPAKTVATKYGFTASQAWLDHVRASSLRIAGGCSASFVSPQGLVMTNHHCVVDCVEARQRRSKILSKPVLLLKVLRKNGKCDAFELDQLIQIRDVTAEVQQAVAGKTGEAANTALHAKEAELQKSCGSIQASLRCRLAVPRWCLRSVSLQTLRRCAPGFRA